MERLIGGTEIQLGLLPLFKDVPHTREDLDKIVDTLIVANNKTKLYGIASSHEEGKICSRLFNGGLLYSDLGHPEYATPECRNLADFPAYELAGRRIVESLLTLISVGKKKVYSIFANNTDYQYRPNRTDVNILNTFAYHENYKSKDPNRKVDRLLPFLVTRQIYAGAGMVIPARLQTGRLDKMDYSLSQRALVTSIWSNPKGLKGLRVGSYSNAVGESRHIKNVLHITLGDANVSDYSTKLKIGTTALVNQLLEDRWKMPNYLQVEPLQALSNLRNIALYPNFSNFQKWHFHAGRYTISAIDVQRIYMEAATRYLDRDEDTDWTLLNWEITLDQLEQDPMSADKLDWVIKKKLIDKLKAKGFSEQELIRADIGYHAADWKKSIFRLVGKNDTTDGQISHAINHAPSNTRAAGREIILRAIAQERTSRKVLPIVDWDFIVYGDLPLNMPQPERTYLDEAQKFVRKLG